MTERNEVLRVWFPDDDVSVIEGEFVPPSQEPDDPSLFEFDDEAFQYINCGPIKLKRMIESKDPSLDQKALLIAKQFWDMRSCPHEVGEPFRGEAVAAQHVRKLSDLVRKYEGSPQSMGSLAVGGESSVPDLFDFLTMGDGHEDQGTIESGP